MDNGPQSRLSATKKSTNTTRSNILFRGVVFELLFEGVGLPIGGGPVTSGSEGESDSSSNSSEDADVVKELVKDDLVDHVPHDGGHSGDELDELMEGEDAPKGVGVLVLPDPGDHVPVVPVPDLVAEPPAFDFGAQRAEVSRNGKAKCLYCGDVVAKGTVRFQYCVFKSQVRYIHAGCLHMSPHEHHAHSHAALRYQRDFGGGPDVLAINDAIDAALATIM